MKTAPIINYVKWVIEQVYELKNNSTPTFYYKIIDHLIYDNKEELVIQIAGKNAFIKIDPKELIKDESMLRGFSPLDVRTITYLACQNKNPVKKTKLLYSIVEQFFSLKGKKEMFNLKTDDGLQIIKSAQDISSNAELINQLSSEDAHRIGFVSGTEQAEAGMDFFLQKKNNKQSKN